MQVDSYTFTDDRGWHPALPPSPAADATLVLVFGSPRCQGVDLAQADLRRTFPGAALAGCSTSGEISGDTLLDASLVATVVRFARTRVVQATTALDGSADSRAAGARLAAELQADDLKAVLLLSDGLDVNGSQLVDGLVSGLEAGVAVVGGLAGDDDRFAQTWVASGADRGRSRVTAIGLHGQALRIGAGYGGGWSDFGPERAITRSSANVLHELDGRPALELYKTYLGEFAQELPGSALRFPLQVRGPEAGAELLVRTVLGVDEASQSMTFAGDIPQGGTARLMRANHARLIDAAGQAAAHASEAAGRPSPGEPALVLSVSCVGRRMLLGEHTEDELEAVCEMFPSGSVHAGFYSYGEIAPAGGDTSRLHNQTIGVTVIREMLG